MMGTRLSLVIVLGYAYIIYIEKGHKEVWWELNWFALVCINILYIEKRVGENFEQIGWV